MATDLPGILIVDDNEDNRYTRAGIRWSRAYRQRGWWKRGDRAHREGEIQPRPARSDDARFERGRGSQSEQERSGQARYPGHHDQRRHGRRQGFAMHRARRRRLSAEAIQFDHLARADRGGAAQTLATSAESE